MCDNRHYISEVPLSLNSVRKRVEAFLSSNGLRLAALERYVVISRDEDGDEIIAGGGLDGNVIKCVGITQGGIHPGQCQGNRPAGFRGLRQAQVSHYT